MSGRKEALELDESTSDSGGILSSLRPSGITSRIASLADFDDTSPDPRAHTDSAATIRSTSADVVRPPRNVEACWQEYEENPIIQTSNQAFASEIFEAGWWVTADNEETEEQAQEFLKNVGIEGGRPHKPFERVGRQAVIQHQARGDFMAEKVTDEKGRHIALNPLNSSTVEIYTKPGVNMLVPPDYTGEVDSSVSDDGTLKETPSGETAAYVQFDVAVSRWKRREERRFTREQIMHWPRNPDVGSVFGESVVNPVLERSRALREKLQDNDLAIAMKAWPMVMFRLGVPERPWSHDRQEDFMDDYDEQNLGPGMYQGVPGDVEVKEFAGETADISDHVMTDVDMIVSAMPGPKHALGAFSVGAGLTDAHDQQFKKKVRDTRRDLENLFTPYIEEALESWGYDTSGLELHIGRPDGDVAPEDIQGSIIRYTSDAADTNKDGNIVEIPNDDGDGSGDSDDNGGGSDGDSGGEDSPFAGLAEPGVYQYGDPFGTDELAEMSETADTLGDRIGSMYIAAMDSVRDDIGAESRHDAIVAGQEVMANFEAEVAQQARASELSDAVRDAVETCVDDAIATVEAEGYGGTHTVDHTELIEQTRRSIINEVTALGNEIGAELRRHTESIAQTGRSEDAVLDRIDDVYADDKLAYRGELLAQMALVRCRNRAKKYAYEHAGVNTVGIESRCLDSTHAVTAELAGCSGDRATASLDSERSLGEQFEAQCSVTPQSGFSPLPDVPPFAFGSKAELVAIDQ